MRGRDLLFQEENQGTKPKASCANTRVIFPCYSTVVYCPDTAYTSCPVLQALGVKGKITKTSFDSKKPIQLNKYITFEILFPDLINRWLLN